MVNVEVKLSYLQNLLGEKINEKKVAEILSEIGMELEESSEGILKIDITAERPDMVSAEGIARAIKSYIKRKNNIYKAIKSDYKVIIEKSVEKVRPYTACAVIKGLKFDDDKIKEIIWVQEKLHSTYCRNRKRAAIGIYPLEKIKMPIYYKALKPENIKFAPLGFSKILNGKQILEQHPTGIEYKHLLEKESLYPVFIDSAGKILSMPPIINSNDVGKVTENTKDIFIECSGFSFRSVSEILNILVTMFIDMGGKAYEMALEYPDTKKYTPELSMESRKIKIEYVNKILGTNLNAKKVKEALERMGYLVEKYSKNEVSLKVPPYRTDIWHDVDIVDDIARGYGFNNIAPEQPKIATEGKIIFSNRIKKKISEIMLGMKFQEVFTFSLTNEKNQYKDMMIENEPHICLGFSTDKSVNMVRTWLLPEVLKCFVANRNKDFPQKIFEIEHVVIPDEKSDVKSKTVWRMAIAISDSSADFTKIRQPVESLFEAIGINYIIKEKEHNSFIPGRCASVIVMGKEIAYFGELHPQVLENFDLTMPVAACEIDFEYLLEILKKGD